jgi:putative MFS transporter
MTRDTVAPVDARAASLRLNLANRIERLPNTGYQRMLFLIIATAWFLDVVDLSSVTYILAPMSSDLGLEGAQSGLIVSAGFLGMAIGATSAGALADRFGRLRVFQYSMIVWGVASILLAFAWSFESAVAFRVMLGLGMGAEFPVAAALLAEITPARKRGRAIAWGSQVSGAIAFVAAGLLSLALIPTIGWRGFFIVEGALAVFVLIIRFAVPESPRWLEGKGRFADAEAVISKIESKTEKSYGHPLPEPGAAVHVATQGRGGIRQLFARGVAKSTVMIWILWFFVPGGYYGLQSWIGKMLADSGITVAQSIAYVLLMVLWGIPGALIAGILTDKLGRKASLVGFVILSAIAAFVYGQAGDTVQLIIAGSFMQFFFFGMWACLYAYTGDVFPTAVRSLGSGTASTLGRLGAIISPIVLPIVLQAMGLSWVFILIVVIPFIIGTMAVLVLGPETKGKVLEDVIYH